MNNTALALIVVGILVGVLLHSGLGIALVLIGALLLILPHLNV